MGLGKVPAGAPCPAVHAHRASSCGDSSPLARSPSDASLHAPQLNTLEHRAGLHMPPELSSCFRTAPVSGARWGMPPCLTPQGPRQVSAAPSHAASSHARPRRRGPTSRRRFASCMVCISSLSARPHLQLNCLGLIFRMTMKMCLKSVPSVVRFTCHGQPSRSACHCPQPPYPPAARSPQPGWWGAP